jgi:phosphosulfolactate synthase (CoM biosynthesis protein A)
MRYDRDDYEEEERYEEERDEVDRDEVDNGFEGEEEVGERDNRRSLMHTIFSWSIEEMMNKDLYRGKVYVISLLH